MIVDRSKASTQRTETLASELTVLHGPCVGCTNCTGLCAALIDALVVPDLILASKS